MLKRHVGLLVLLLIIQSIAGRLLGQHKSIEINSPVPIPLPSSDRSTAECNLAIHPMDARYLLLSMLSANPFPKGNDYYTLPLVTFDGGKTWQASAPGVPGAADPWGVITSMGTSVVADISGGEAYTLATRYSPDGGRTWEDTLSFGQGYDHSLLLVDDSDGPFQGSVYLVATQSLLLGRTDTQLLVARSTDGGRSFSRQHRHVPFRNVDFNAKTPVVLSDGTLLIPILIRGSYSPKTQTFTAFDQMQSWLLTSTDGGKTFDPPLFIAHGSGWRHNLLAIDRSANRLDHLYYVFAGPDRKGLFFTRSTDRGESWSEPVRIDGSTAAVPWTDLGAIAVSRQGNIGLVFTERQQSGATACYRTYFTASVDGGSTFLTPAPLHTDLSCPEKQNGWVANAWPQGGDYCGLVAFPDGSFFAVWSDARQGLFRSYSATIHLR
jgi:hypothetical protein